MKRYIFQFFLSITVFFVGFTDVHAQGEIMFTSSRNLSSSMVNNIYQDNIGLVWISSEDGLDVYDGTKFWNIHHLDGDTLSLVSNYVRFVCQDTDNMMLVATLHGLQYFDRSTRKFHNVPIYSEFSKLGITPSISAICRLNDSVSVVGTSGYGMMLLMRDGDGYRLNTHPGVGYGGIATIYKDKDGYVWVTGGNFVKKLDSTLTVLEEWTIPSTESVAVVTCDNDGSVLFGTTLGRVLVYAPDAPSKYREIVSTEMNEMSVTSFCIDADGSVLFGTDGRGAKRLIRSGDSWVMKDFEFAIVDNSRLKIHDIMRDRDGNFWFASFQRGVLLVRGGGSMFDYIGRISRKRNIIGNCCVTAVYSDSDRNIYVGTDNDGFYVLDKNYNFLKHYDGKTPGSLVPNVTLSFCEDSKGRLWVGGYKGGLVYLDRKTGKWTRYQFITENGGGGLANVYAIVEDRQTQTLWASVSGSGIYKIDENTLESKLFTTRSDTYQHDFTVDQLCNAWVVSMMISSDRKLYVGTYSGVSCMDLDTENFVNTYGTNCFMEGYVVNNICESPDGHIWLSSSEGLFRFDVHNRYFKRYGLDEGLPSASITGIACDSAGNMWISSKSGVSCLDSKTGMFVNYDAFDGLYSNEFMPGAVCMDNDGRVMFGSVNGVVVFTPSMRRERSKTLNVRITNFSIDNEPVAKGVKSGDNDVIDTDVFFARRFHLAHFDNSFEVEFSALDFENPDRLTYSYRFDDGQWTKLSGNSVSFAKVGYGIHTLEACVTDNMTTSDVYSVTIEIDFPWYESTWFEVSLTLFLIALLVVAALLVMRRIRINRHFKEIARAKELNDSRVEFFTSISHEIRTPISLIISPLIKLMETDGDTLRQRSYKTIKLNAQRILNLINQLLDMRKIDSHQMKLEFEKTDLVAFCRGIYESFEQYALSLGVEFVFEAEEEAVEAYIDPKNFDKVVVNVLSNAFKYTPKGGRVKLALFRAEQDKLCVEVADQGTGIAPEDIDHIFELFYQGDNNHKISMVGTGVGMYLVRQLVTLHHGDVKVFNNPEGEPGCTFQIRIPSGREHLRDEEIVERNDADALSNAALSTVVPDVYDEELKRYARTSTRLVVVDDDEQLRKYIVEELGNYFHIKDFASCDEASTYIIKNKPDLVISDVMMEGMDGFTLCMKLKRNVETNTIPVILLTAASQDYTHIRALDIGADAYITKPFSISVLTHTVTNLLKRHNTLRNSYLGRQDNISGAPMADSDNQVAADSPDKKLLLRVLKVINENMSNPNLTVDLIAKSVGISRVHLHRKLKELTNQSTIDFLRNVRLNRALKLLRIKHNSIFEVAQQVGFVSTAYFSTVFKDRFGCTPSAYMSDNATIEQVPLDDEQLIS